MDLSILKGLTVPLIVITTYIIMECLKIAFGKKVSKYIPIIASGVGLILGVVFYFVIPSEIVVATSPVIAAIIGMASGFASTGVNQAIRQLKTEKTDVVA